MAGSASPLLSVRDVVAGYGKLPILHGVSFEVAAGEIVTLVGPDGSGKSTRLKATGGLADIHSGTDTLDGRDVTRQDTEATVRAGRGYVPRRDDVVPGLPVRE